MKTFAVSFDGCVRFLFCQAEVVIFAVTLGLIVEVEIIKYVCYNFCVRYN